MKLKDVMKIENVGKKYRCGGSEIWVLENFFGDYSICGLDLKDNDGDSITRSYFLGKILELDFEEVVDWDTVEVNTVVKVRMNWGDTRWRIRHFAKYEDGYVKVWANGRTSYTVQNEFDTEDWDEVVLFNEEEIE